MAQSTVHQHNNWRKVMTMKTKAAAAVLAFSSIFTTAAMAKPVDITACTKDGNTATLHIDVEGTVSGQRDASAPRPLEILIQAAYTKTMNSVTTDQLLDGEWEAVFKANLQEVLQGTQPSSDAKVDFLGGDITSGCTLPQPNAPATPAP
jgi:hypothetical protein